MVPLMALRMLMMIMTDETKSVSFKSSIKRWRWHSTPSLLQCFLCRGSLHGSRLVQRLF